MSNFNIKNLLSTTDFSRGTEAFADDLLGRCLSVLGQEEEEFAEISDDELEFLAAAGNPFANQDDDFNF